MLPVFSHFKIAIALSNCRIPTHRQLERKERLSVLTVIYIFWSKTTHPKDIWQTKCLVKAVLTKHFVDPMSVGQMIQCALNSSNYSL